VGSIFVNDFGDRTVFLNGKDITDLMPQEVHLEDGWVRVRRLKVGGVIRSGHLFRLRGKVELQAPAEPEQIEAVPDMFGEPDVTAEEEKPKGTSRKAYVRKGSKPEK